MTNDGHNYTAASFSPDWQWLVYERALSTQRIVDERITHGGISRTKDMEFFGPPWNSRALEVMIEQSPFFRCGNTKVATLFVHGDVDYRVLIEGAIQLYTCLKTIGVPTKMIIYEGQAHGINGHWNLMHRMLNELRWWEQYLK